MPSDSGASHGICVQKQAVEKRGPSCGHTCGFGIGEPVLFGAPVMLNPLLYLPMVLSIIVNQVFTYTAIMTGLIGRSTGVVLPWTTPPVLYPLLANSTSVQAAILNVVIIFIDIIIWLPFVKAYDRNTVLKETEAEKE